MRPPQKSRKPAHKSRISVPATYSLRTHHVLTTYLQLTHNVLATYLQLAHRAIERCDERLFDRRRDGGNGELHWVKAEVGWVLCGE